MKLKVKKLLGSFLIIIMLLLTAGSFMGSAAPISDQDSDGDGLTDDQEDTNNDGNYTVGSETNPLDPDTDGDGIIDSEDDEPLNDDMKLRQYHDDEKGKYESGNSLLNTFLFVLLMGFAVFSLIAGIFTAYFGAGKSRAIGGVLLVLGLIIIMIYIYFGSGSFNTYPDDTLLGIVHWEAAKTTQAFVTVIGAIIGALIAIVLFLVAIMKS